jgi:hypothetical protein
VEDGRTTKIVGYIQVPQRIMGRVGEWNCPKTWTWSGNGRSLATTGSGSNRAFSKLISYTFRVSIIPGSPVKVCSQHFQTQSLIMQLSKILSGVLILLLAPLAMAVPLDSEANIVPRSNNRIFVGGLPISTSSETLESMLAQSGHVVDVHIISDTK